MVVSADFNSGAAPSLVSPVYEVLQDSCLVAYAHVNLTSDLIRLTVLDPAGQEVTSQYSVHVGRLEVNITAGKVKVEFTPTQKEMVALYDVVLRTGPCHALRKERFCLHYYFPMPYMFAY